MTVKKTGTSPVWKWLFLLLLALNISFVAVIAQRLLQVREPEVVAVTAKKAKATKIGSFTTTKDELNDTLSAYLKKYQSKDFSYKVYAAAGTILFEGKYKLLGYDVPLYIYFEPYRLADGSIQLKLTSFSAGTLPLPEKEVLQMIKKSYDLPKIVSIKPKETSILIKLPELENELGIYLEAVSLDLVNDKIVFDIYKKKD